MGLDAFVYCDCIERGRLLVPHPFPHLLKVGEDGSPFIDSTLPEYYEPHNRWESDRPCPHHDFLLLHQWISNVSGAARMTTILIRPISRSRCRIPGHFVE